MIRTKKVIKTGKNRLFFSTFIPVIFITAFLILGFSKTKYTLENVTDIDGNIYKTIKIGDQVWMAENLKVNRAPDGKPIKSYFYMDDSVKYGKYGRLYKWGTAINGARIAVRCIKN
ncbi:FISUMP domain-containing protein [candidate division KSB1 bacterium]